MKVFATLILSLVLLVVGYLYLFPHVELLSDHCHLCRRSRVYYQLVGDKYGSTIYNLHIGAPGDSSLTHHHLYVDPQISDTKSVPRWTLHPNGLQSQ